MVAYDDERAIARNGYRESPYFMELAGTWRQKHTDSSLVYTKQLDVERTWKDYRVYLNVRCGHACRVYIGGKLVGYGDDSRQWNEFLITPFLKYGKTNTLVVETLKHPAGALLEDSSIAVGLNDTPFILFRNDPEVCDMGITADYDAALGAGTLTVDAMVFNSRRKGRYYLEVEVLDPKGRQVDRMGRWIVFTKSSEEKTDLSRTWPGVRPWSAEEPALYTAILRLRNDNMDVEETLGTTFGFRRVEVADGVMLVNGKPITLRGVTYGLEHTEGETGRQQIAKDLRAMKATGVNAVRTTRFSPMEPYFYTLCDMLGLYVVADANLMPASSGRRVVATEQDMIPLFEQRVEHLYGSLRNHPSIVCWSLGNSRDNGVCMTAAYKRLKVLDKSRPVMFSAAQGGDNTDIVAPVFPTEADLLRLAESASKPVVMAQSTDASRFGTLGALWRAVENNRQLQGGFLDAWPLSSEMNYELRNLYAPFTISMIRVGGGEGEFRVTNNSDFADFSRFRLEYTIYTNLHPNIISGELPLAVAAGESGKVGMRIPQLDMQPGEEPFIKFDISQRSDGRQVWTPVSHTVFPLAMRKAQAETYKGGGAPIVVDEDTLGVLNIAFGRWHVQYDKGLRLYDAPSKRLLAKPTLVFDNVRDCRHTLLASSYRVVDSDMVCIDAMVRYTMGDGRTLCDVRETYAVRSTGDITVDYVFLAPAARRSRLEPAIVSLVWHDNQVMRWYGNAFDRLIDGGRWRDVDVNTIATSDLGYAEERHDVRWCLLADTIDGTAVMARLADSVFAIRQHQDGLALVGPDADGNSFSMRLVMKMLDGSIDSVAALCREATTVYPKVTTGIPEPPVITANAVRFAQPLTVTLKASAGGTIRYTTDGSDPTVGSTVYTKPFVIDATTVVKARVFVDDAPPSFVASRKFNYDYIARTTFSRRPNTPYNVGADTLLFDGERGDVNNLSYGWVGFSGDDVVTVVELAKPLDVESVALRFAHSPAVWAFAPPMLTLAFSADGTEYTDTVVVHTPFQPEVQSESQPRVVEFSVPAERRGVGFVKITAHTIGTIPSWHRGKGLKPWLLMDELEVMEITQ